MPDPTLNTPEQVITTINSMESERSDLIKRMDDDWDRYNLKPYRGELDENGSPILDGYKKFTSNDPQTTVNLAMHFGTNARRTINVHKPRAQKLQREVDNYKELFCLGILASADERRHSLLMPSLQEALFSQCFLRGRWAQRVLLVKEPLSLPQNPIFDGIFSQFQAPLTRTYVDITDWDPRNTYWKMGKHGLAWACNKSFKTREDILTEYDVDPAESEEYSPDDESRQWAVYDYFDADINMVVLEGDIPLKAPTPHGMGRVPVTLGLVGGMPHFQSENDNYDVHYGESFYHSSRDIFDQNNFMLSVMAELAKRSVSGPMKVFSKDGSLTLEEDPRLTGTDTSLSTENEEEILPYPPAVIAQEAGVLMAAVSSMMQRGTFNYASFGEIPFQLSGFAITQLRQGLEAPLTPHVQAVKTALTQTLNILADAYATGQFDTMSLSGHQQDTQRSWFSAIITPDLIQAGGIIEVDILPNLPQDDLSRVSLAQQMREPINGKPLADDRFIRQAIMNFQDVEQIERAIDEQTARTGSPLAVAWTSYLSALEQGDQELASIWWDEFQRQAMTAWLQTMQLMMFGGGQTSPNLPQQPGQANPQSPTLPRSQFLPPESLGIQSRPIQQSGPLVPPGTPRPGARGV